MNFNEMNLPDYIVSALEKGGITQPTEIQEKCITEIRNGKDVVGVSKTGSGKTFAYALPAIEMLEDSHKTQVLVICPTRELATQVSDEIRKITGFKDGIKVASIFGGSHMDRQLTMLRKGAQIVVGTPGRLMDHLRRRTLKLDALKVAVLDEADEMMDMGFKDDMREILSKANPDRQTVMFSATMPAEVLNITKTFMREPVTVDCIDQQEAQSFIAQHYVSVDKIKKNESTAQLIKDLNPSRAIVFCNTKSMVDILAEFLSRDYIKAVGLHGDMRQTERRAAMTAIKNGQCQVLVATDVAARGLDLKDVEFVLNYDIPNDDDFYIHRIGRTARAGKTGSAFTVITGRNELARLNELMKKTNNQAQEHIFEYSVEIKKKSAKSQNESFKKDVFRKGKTHVVSKDAKRSWGDKPTDGAKRSWGDKPTDGAKKSWGDKPTDGAKKSWGDKPTDGAKKSWGDKPTTGNKKPIVRREGDFMPKSKTKERPKNG